MSETIVCLSKFVWIPAEMLPFKNRFHEKNTIKNVQFRKVYSILKKEEEYLYNTYPKGLVAYIIDFR